MHVFMIYTKLAVFQREKSMTFFFRFGSFYIDFLVNPIVCCVFYSGLKAFYGKKARLKTEITKRQHENYVQAEEKRQVSNC